MRPSLDKATHAVANHSAEGQILDVFGHEELSPIPTTRFWEDDLR
jgi:hypothetical protein